MNQNNINMGIPSGYDPNTGQPIYNNIGQVEYANFGKRLGAYLLDSLLMFGIAILLFLVMTILIFILGILGVDNIFGLRFLYFIIYLLIFFGQPFYCVIAENGKKKRTWGKRVMGIIVKNENNEPMSWGKSLLRCALKLVIPFGSFISMITILATQKKQALHDMILSQVVVVEK